MDNLGNRTSVTKRDMAADTYALDSATNRYDESAGGPYDVTCAYDAAGNTTQDKDNYTYWYDYENRVVKIEKPDGLGGWDDVAEMAYDALGRRIRMIDTAAEPDVMTLYYYNPDWQVLAEYDGSNGLQRYFVYGNYIDEPLVMRRQSDGEDYYYGQDHLYSTVVLLDDGGTVVERYEYDAYGTVLVYTDDGNDDTWFTGDDTTASTSARGNPYTFTGRRLDTVDGGELLRMHYRHRDYDVYAGRFLQQDPRGANPAGGYVNQFRIPPKDVDSLNPFAYVTENPVNTPDPSGLFSLAPFPVPPPSQAPPAGGLTMTVITPPTKTKDFAGGKMVIQWHAPANSNGAIVQEVTISSEVARCRGVFIRVRNTKYVEAWQVYNGVVGTSAVTLGFLPAGADRFAVDLNCKCTAGYMEIRGNAGFFPGLVAGWPAEAREANGLPSRYVPPYPPGLPTDVAPPLGIPWPIAGPEPGGSSSDDRGLEEYFRYNGVKHYLRVEWDDCSSPGQPAVVTGGIL